MRIPIIAAAAIAVALPAVPAMAQSTPRGVEREYRNDRREAQRDYRNDLRRADSRRDVREAQRDYQRDLARANAERNRNYRNLPNWQRYRGWDYNRLEPGQRNYYADRYYRDGRYYRPVTMRRTDRIYRGYDGRYYCRRGDGTTGLIIGGVAGGLLGNALDNGRSSILGAVIGAAGGALIGREVDRGNVTCR